MKPNIAARVTKDQVSSNRSGVGFAASFAGHREHMTQEILARAPAGGAGRLCLLGAGNANDVDLAALAMRFAEIHLVDIDAEAVGRARDAASPATRQRLRLHAPVDLSGFWGYLDTWAAEPGDGARLGAEVGPAVARVVQSLPGPFDVVVSCCMLTQLQLALVDSLSDRHPAFDSFRALTNAIHVRVLVSLMAEGGRALLFTDLTSDDTFPFDALEPAADLGKVMGELVAAGNVIHAAHPGRLSAEIRRDAALSAVLAVRFPIGPWLWHNGPSRTFLVYGLEFEHKAAATAPAPPLAAAISSGGGQTDPASASSGVAVFDDVIPPSYQGLISSQTENLAWYLHKPPGRADAGFLGRFPGFFHLAYDLSAPNPIGSGLYATLAPLLFIGAERAGIALKQVLRIRLELFTENERDVPHHHPHVELDEPHLVGIYFVNDSDGDMVVFQETSADVSISAAADPTGVGRLHEAARISPRQGRMVFFDGRRYHATMHPRRHASRMSVTFTFR